MKRKLTLNQEKEIYEESWREVYNECFFMAIVDRQKIGHIMHCLNVVDKKIIKEKENGSGLQKIDQEGKRAGERYEEGFS